MKKELEEAQKAPVSAENLNEYIHIVSPGIIALITALALVLSAVIFWGFTGRLRETMTITGITDITEDGSVRCFMDASQTDARSLKGDKVRIKVPRQFKSHGKIRETPKEVLSREEIVDRFGYSYWEANQLMPDGTYFYLIDITAEKDMGQYQGQLAEVTVILGEVAPISFLMK